MIDLFASHESVDADVTTPSVEEEFEQQFNEGVESTLSELAELPTEVAAPVEMIAGIPVDEFKTVFEKAKLFDELQASQKKMADDLNGKFGGLKQQIDQVRAARGSVSITPDKFAAVAEFFGDEGFAEALAKDLGSISLGATETPVVDWEAKIAEVETKLSQNFEKKLLTSMHPDWQQITAVDQDGAYVNKDYVDWLGTLSEEGRDRVLNSWDAFELGEALSKHKEWLTKREENQRNKQQRLEGNVSPRGGASPVGRSSLTSYEADFNEGLKQTLKDRAA